MTMSKEREIIVLEPRSRKGKEEFRSRAVSCPYCGGKGWFYSGEREPETMACPDCEGSGELMAVITIDWKPNKK